MNKLQLSRFEKDTSLITQTVVIPASKVIATTTYTQSLQIDTVKKLSRQMLFTEPSPIRKR